MLPHMLRLFKTLLLLTLMESKLMASPALPDLLKQDVNVLAGQIGERNLQHYQALLAAERYITEQWQASAYKVRRQTYQVKGKEVANLEVELRAHKKPQELLIIGAHYDSVTSCPGANDNGSGVAALLALSRL